jgi:hypothetical protein
VRTLLPAQLIAAVTGLALGAGARRCAPAGAAMVTTILLTLARAAHPLAVATAPSFASKAGSASSRCSRNAAPLGPG